MDAGNKEYMTVKDFAEVAGVTRQTIYSQIDRGVLSDFVVEIDGAKMIDRDALSKFGSQKTVKRQSNDSQKELIKALQDRIAAQEKTIEEQQQTIRDLTAAVTGAQQLQYLERQERMKLLEVKEAAPSSPSSEDAADPQSGENSTTSAAPSDCGYYERNGVRFFDWIFKRKSAMVKEDNHK